MGAKAEGIRLADCVPRELVDDIFAHALKKQTGVSLKYMLDFGSNPIERQLVLSSQFLHKELPVRLAHRVAELENLPYGLSSKSAILKVRRQQQLGPARHARGAHSHTHSVSPAAAAVACWRQPGHCLHAVQHSHIGAEAYTAGTQACVFLPAQQQRQTLQACMSCVLRLQVRDWYVESFNELRSFPRIQVSSSHGACRLQGRSVQQHRASALISRPHRTSRRLLPSL